MVEIATAYVNVVPTFDPDISRFQVLELPMVHSGDYSDTPFALILDGTDPDAEDIDLDALRDFKEAVGAKAIFVTKARIAV